MDSDNQGQHESQLEILEKVKKRAVAELSKVLSQVGSDNPERKFDIAMATLRYGTNPELADVAIDATLAVEDPAAKADMLMQVLNEINYLEDNLK